MSEHYGSQSLGLGVAKGPSGALVISEKDYGTNRNRLGSGLVAGEINRNRFGGGSLRPP